MFLCEQECVLTESEVYEMASIQPEDSGLKQLIFVSTKDYVGSSHWARIKVSNVYGTFSKEDNFVVSVDKNPKILAGKSKYTKDQLNDIFDWVKLNYEVLMKYWKNEFNSTKDFYLNLKKI